MSNFYGDWIFYGGLIGVLGIGVTTYICGKKIGVNNLNWKHYSIIIVIFMFPSVILPILLMPDISLSEKVGITVALTLFGAVRYYATTKSQEAVAEMRERKKKQNEKSE